MTPEPTIADVLARLEVLALEMRAGFAEVRASLADGRQTVHDLEHALRRLDVPNSAGWERAGTIGATADHHWYWVASDSFEFWEGPTIERSTISPVYRLAQ